MKAFLIISLIFTLSTQVRSQLIDAYGVAEVIYELVDTMPEFPKIDRYTSSEKSMAKYLTENLMYPIQAKADNIQGTVYVSFIVDKNGDVIRTKINRGIHPSLNKEALNVIELMPKWKPAIQGGRNVNVSFVLPVKFRLDAKSPKRTVSNLELSEASSESGKRFVQAGKYNKAILLFSNAVKLDDTNKEAHHYRGVCNYELKNTKAACTDWLKAKSLKNKESKPFLKKHCK